MLTLWNCVLVSPCGLPQEFKLRAPSEAMLRDRIATYKPDWSIATDEYGNALIRRESRYVGRPPESPDSLGE